MELNEQHWQSIKSDVKQQIPEHSYRMWIEPLEFVRDDSGEVVISCPNLFSKRRVQENFSSIIESVINQSIPGKMRRKVVLEISERKIGQRRPSMPAFSQLQLPEMDGIMTNGRMLRKSFTFDRFVVGGNSDFAYSAAYSLASRKKGVQNSLYLLSDTGLGKSHLSQAVGHHILSKYPGQRVYYITAEDFTNEMVRSFRSDSIETFKEKYRKNCDVLILEDIQFLTGKGRTQVELALALDYLMDADKKIIFSSCYLPMDIPKMNEQLRSRFASTLITNIEPPDFRTRVKIIQQKLQEQRFEIPNNVIDYLAGELTENVRQLESGINGVTTKAQLLNKPINVSLAKSVVEQIVRRKKAVTIDVIKKLVSKHYHVSVQDLESKSRKRDIVRPRHIAIYLARKFTDQTLQAIGKSFNRYHATAIRSIGAVEKGMKTDITVRKQVEYLSSRLEAGEF